MKEWSRIDAYPETRYPVYNLQVRHVWTKSRGLVSPFDNPDAMVKHPRFRRIQLRAARAYCRL